MSSNNKLSLRQRVSSQYTNPPQDMTNKDQSSDIQDIDTTGQEAPESYQKRFKKQLARLSTIDTLRRSSSKLETSSSIRRQSSTIKTKIGLQRSISKKDIQRPSLLMVPDMNDPLLFTNPRRAPTPPGGDSGIGGFLTSALDSGEVQEASVLAMELAATKPTEAAALRRKAEAARKADLAAEKARSAALVAEEAAVECRREVAYMIRSLKGDM